MVHWIGLRENIPETQETMVFVQRWFLPKFPSNQPNVVLVNTGSNVCPQPLQLALVKFIIATIVLQLY